MMIKQINNRGMALILVLSLSVSLLSFAIIYFQSNSKSRPINERHFERAQADFLGQGIVQLAAMKFKKRPAEFYYAYQAAHSGQDSAPLASYLGNDTTLNGEFTDQKGLIYRYRTNMQMITHDLYKTDGIRIIVEVEQLTSTGEVALSRIQEHVIEAVRSPI